MVLLIDSDTASNNCAPMQAINPYCKLAQPATASLLGTNGQLVVVCYCASAVQMSIGLSHTMAANQVLAPTADCMGGSVSAPAALLAASQLDLPRARKVEPS